MGGMHGGDAGGFLLLAVAKYDAVYYAGLAALLVALAWAAYIAVDSWREAHEDLDPAGADELMRAFEQARADGELDEQEFARVRRELEASRGVRPLDGSDDVSAILKRARESSDLEPGSSTSLRRDRPGE